MISLAISDIIIGFTVLVFVVNAVNYPKYYPGEGPEHKYLVDILVLNSILDPIIYTVRLAKVQLDYLICLDFLSLRR